jgi:anti-anti-sigma regulatory factor
MQLYLIVAKGKHQGMPILIKVDLFLMGSEKLCQLRSSLPGIAPQHCALITRDKKVFVRDLGGGKTFVNHELVPAETEWPLHKGDRLAVGPLEFTVQFQEKQSAQPGEQAWAQRALDHDNTRAQPEFEDDEEEEALAGMPATAAAAAALLGKLKMQKGVVKGRLRIMVHGDITQICFNDHNMVEWAEISFLKRELLDAARRPNQRVLLDFKNVRRMSSTAADMIQDVCRHVRDHGGSVAFCRVRSEIRTMMETLGIFASLRYFDDKKTALDATW